MGHAYSETKFLCYKITINNESKQKKTISLKQSVGSIKTSTFSLNFKLMFTGSHLRVQIDLLVIVQQSDVILV